LGQGKLGAFRVALTNFDRTLTQLFDQAALQAAYLHLRVFYERHGVPEEYLPDQGDPYSATDEVLGRVETLERHRASHPRLQDVGEHLRDDPAVAGGAGEGMRFQCGLDALQVGRSVQ